MPTRASAPRRGSVSSGASPSRQPNQVAIQIYGGASNAVSQRDVRQKTKDIHERDEWVASIKEKLQYYTRSEAAETETISIPRVPKGHRGFDQGVEKAYESCVISIGPYHRGMPYLNNMQKRKWKSLKYIIEHLHLNDLFKKLKKEDDRARSSYPESEQQLERGDFLEMMLLYDCFRQVMEIDAEASTSELETETDIRKRVEWVASIQNKLQDYTRSEADGEMPHLNNMQKRKWQCLKDTLDLDLHLNDLFKELKKEEDRARSFYEFYPESEQQLNSGDFLEMLLLDGCFIVDYLRLASSGESKTKIWSDLQLRNDLLLLENQLPFCVVECIYRLVKQPNNNKELIQTAVKFFHIISPRDQESAVFDPKKKDFKHLLHLYHAYLFFDEHDSWEDKEAYQVQERGMQEKGASQVRTIPSAILLKEAGIKFRKRKKIDRVINVRFKAGVMNITHLTIDAFNISLFLNLIEFERAHPDMEPRFTAFLQFMDCIINTAEDVALLRKNGILDHAFGSDKEVADIFNQLTSGTFHQLSWELKKIYGDTNKHYKNYWNRCWATLFRDHFRNLWATIAILAAVLLLCFDFIQAFFAVYSYFWPRSAS